MQPDAELPTVDGGWEVQSHAVAPGVDVRVWVPRAPDRLLDDDGVIQRNEFNDSMPYWAWLWDSAPLMARLIAADPPRRGARILELGAGLGFAGIAAALVADGPVELTLTDHDPLALGALPANAALNGLTGARVADLDWHRPGDVADERFDLVLGCDVAYEAKLQEPLLDVVQRVLAPDGRALFADPGRTRLPGLVRRAHERGLAVEIVDERGDPARPEAGAFRLVALR